MTNNINTTMKTLIIINSEHVFYNSFCLLSYFKINVLHSFIVYKSFTFLNNV